MFLHPLAVTAFVVLGAATPSTAVAQEPSSACEVTQAKYARYTRTVYREREKISDLARDRIYRLLKCAKSEEAERNMVELRRREARDREERQREENAPYRFALASWSDRVEMARYMSHPMPWCTWGPESGVGRPEWSLQRYRQPNVSGGSGGGKFQILTSTWIAFGGLQYASGPVVASPVHQERIARKIAGDSLHHWVNC